MVSVSYRGQKGVRKLTPDNGYIQFTYVRVPRAHMLMKHTQVSRDGEVTEPVSSYRVLL